MTKDDIDIAAKEYVELQNRLNVIRTPQYYYRAGAEFVNEKQPFSKDSVISLFSWMIKRGWVMYDEFAEVFFRRNSYEAKKFDELIKLWEDSKNG